MASNSIPRGPSGNPRNSTNNFLLRENEELKRKIKWMEKEMESLRKKALNTSVWRTRAGVWVGGYWCSVKRFVAVQPKRKVWKGRDGAILASLKGLGDRMIKLEGMVNGVGRGVWRQGEGKRVVRVEDKEREEWQRMEEGSDSKGEKYRREMKKETGLSVFAKPFVFEPKGKKVDFGGGPPSPRGEDLIWSWEKDGIR